MDRLASRRIVLLGIGHTHAHVVRMWGKTPIHDTELVCISDNSIATYSGLLPAVLSGQCPESAMQIDLPRLCNSVRASLITDQVAGLNSQRNALIFQDRPELPFDVLSIGIGSIPSTEGVTFCHPNSAVQLKPMRSFLQRLHERLRHRLIERAATATPVVPEHPFQVIVAGAGAAGVEIACCISPFLETHGIHHYRITLISTSEEILPGVSAGLRRRVLSYLNRHYRQFQIIPSARISHVDPSEVRLLNGQVLNSDLVLWATGAQAPPLLADLGLPVDERGFLLTDSTLRSTSGLPIFAVGDSGTIDDCRLSKAGVYAVRQGPILWENLNRTLRNEPLRHYMPQTSFMKLLNLGDGSAAGEWKGFSFTGRWVMTLKNRIDHKFMRMYQNIMPAMMSDDEQCRGCGCKLGSNQLQSVLSKLEPTDSLHSSQKHKPVHLDDAAVISFSSGAPVIASTDFFTPPFRDHWLNGRIATQHAITDLYAMGAKVTSALATIVLPEGSAAAQQQILTEILHGIRFELNKASAKLVGGHTIVGPRLELGLTVLGEPFGTQLLEKRNLKPGDRLYLTKPLGVGILLAASMRSQCPATHYDELIESMLQSQESVARLAVDYGLTAATDVTGFGLLGHLAEMLKASQCTATLDLDCIPLLPGAIDAINAGIQSTLTPENYRIPLAIEQLSRRQIKVHPESESAFLASAHASQSYKPALDDRCRPILELLYDPQTCGGLLLAAPPDLQLPFSAHPIGKVDP